MSSIMKSIETGELVIVESIEEAYKMLETGAWLFGFLSFLDKKTLDAFVASEAAKL